MRGLNAGYTCELRPGVEPGLPNLPQDLRALEPHRKCPVLTAGPHPPSLLTLPDPGGAARTGAGSLWLVGSMRCKYTEGRLWAEALVDVGTAPPLRHMHAHIQGLHHQPCPGSSAPSWQLHLCLLYRSGCLGDEFQGHEPRLETGGSP